MKKNFLLIIVCIFFIPFTGRALVTKSNDIFITDDAGVIDSDTKKYIIQYSSFLKQEKDIDYYVVTLSHLENLTLDEYTDYIYSSFHLNERGFLIVVSKSERNISIKAGKGLHHVITNELIDEYIKKYFLPYFKSDDWSRGIQNGYSAFYKKICESYHIDASEMIVDTGDTISQYQSFILVIIVWICTVFGYVYGKYYNRVFLRQESILGNHVIFGISFFVNILLLYYCIFVKELAIPIIIGFEMITFYSTMDKSHFKKKKKVKKRKKKR